MKRRIGKMMVFLVIAALPFFLLNGNVWSAQNKPIKLLFAAFDPEPAQWGQAMKDWAKDLEERTKGRVKVDISWASALGRPHDYYDFVKKGICDVAQVVPAFVPGMFPMSDVISLPFIVPTAEIGGKALMEFAKKGYLDKEFEDVKVLFLYTGIGDTVFTTSKPVKTLADVEGLKIIGAAPPICNRIKIMGSVPISMGSPMDLYPLLQKKTADGLVLNYPIIIAFKLQEVLKYSIEPGMGTGLSALMMNKKYYQKLPSDIQAILNEMAEKHAFNFAAAFDKRSDFAKDLFVKAGGQFTQWSPQDMAKMGDQFELIWKSWIEENEKKGLPARQALNDFYHILEDLGVENPAVGYRPSK